MLKMIAVTAALSVAFAACTPMTTPETANVRVAHLSPGTPNVDIWVNGKVLDSLKNVSFKTVSPYLKLPLGATDIAVYVAGTTTNPAITASVTLEKKNYTVAAIGLLSGTGNAALKANVYTDDLTTNATQARVRVIHASPDAPAVDVGLKGGTPADALVKNLAFPNATGYLELAPNVYSLEIRAAGAANAVFSFDTPSLAAGKVYTVFAVGRLNTAGEFGVIAQADAAQ